MDSLVSLRILSLLHHPCTHLYKTEDPSKNVLSITLKFPKRLYFNQESFIFIKPSISIVTFSHFTFVKEYLHNIHDQRPSNDFTSLSYGIRTLLLANLPEIKFFYDIEEMEDFLITIDDVLQSTQGIWFISNFVSGYQDAAGYPTDQDHLYPITETQLEYVAIMKYGKSFQNLSEKKQKNVETFCIEYNECQVNYGNLSSKNVVVEGTRCICRQCGGFISCIHNYYARKKSWSMLMEFLKYNEDTAMMTCNYCSKPVMSTISFAYNVPPMIQHILDILDRSDTFEDLDSTIYNKLKYDKHVRSELLQQVNYAWGYNILQLIQKRKFITIRQVTKAAIDVYRGVDNEYTEIYKKYLKQALKLQNINNIIIFQIKRYPGYQCFKRLLELLENVEMSDNDFIDAIYLRKEIAATKYYSLAYKFKNLISEIKVKIEYCNKKTLCQKLIRCLAQLYDIKIDFI